MRIGFLSTNAHKFEETQAILAELYPEATVVQVVPDEDVEETGETFEANALIKLEAGLAMLAEQKNDFDYLLAEDAGLVVDALDGTYGISPFPGVQSNRWLTLERQVELLGSQEFETRYGAVNAALLRLLSRTHSEAELNDSEAILDRSARYVSVMAAWSAQGNQVNTVRGQLELTVGRNAQGTEGFGYDPIMHLRHHELSAQSIGELPASLKNSISHRRQALSEWVSHHHNF